MVVYKLGEASLLLLTSLHIISISGADFLNNRADLFKKKKLCTFEKRKKNYLILKFNDRNLISCLNTHTTQLVTLHDFEINK